MKVFQNMNFEGELKHSIVLLVLLGAVGLATFAGTASAQGTGNVAVEMRPADTNVNVGDDIRIDMVVVDPDNGVQGVDFNATTSDVLAAEFEDNESAFDFAREGDIQFGGSTATETPAGANRWVNTDAVWDPIIPASSEVTIGTFNLTATGTGIAELNWVNPNSDTQVFEDGGVQYTVTDTQNATIQVGDDPLFDVSITGANDPVNETETLSVNAEVTNTGDITGTQTISLRDTGFNDQLRDTVDVTLDGGETNSSIKLEWDTQFGDNGTGDVTVASDNTSASQTVEVQEIGAQPVDSCSVIDESGAYELGTPLGPTSSTCIEIRASDVTFNGQGNTVTGDSPGFGEFGIFVNGTGTPGGINNVDVRNVVVQDWSGTAGLVYNGANGTASNVRAFRNGDGIRIEGGSSASGTAIQDSVARNNTNGINIDAANGVNVSSNEATDNDNGIFEDSDSGGNDYVDNNASANTNNGISIEGGSSTLIGNGAMDNANGISISSSNNNLTDNQATNNDNGILVADDGNDIFSNDVSANANGIEVTSAGNSLTSNTAENNDIGIEIDSASGNTVEENTVSNNNQKGFNVTSSDNNVFTNNAAVGNGNWDFSVFDSSGNTVTGLDIGASTEANTELDFTGNDFNLRSEPTPEPDPAGEVNIGRYFDATNTSASGSLSVDLSYEDSDVPDGADESSLELLRYNGTEWVPIPTSSRDTTKNIVSADISEFSQFGAFADPQPFFEVNITDTNEPVVEGNNLTVNGTITNTGLASDTQEVNLTEFDGTEVDSENFTLSAGGSTTFNFVWNTSVGDVATDNVTVASENETDQQEVRIVPPVFFDVQITGTNSPVVEGDTLQVDGTVENLGGETDTQELNLTITDFGGKETDNESITLTGLSSDTFSFNWNTELGDNGTGSVTVFSENTSDQATVTVSNRSESEADCINRRDISRGQEDQECPNDREISRGGSREDLDRRTGRDSDTRRRDRSRGESGR